MEPAAELDAMLLSAVSKNADESRLLFNLRALQIAAWHHDLLVTIDITQLLHSEERPRSPIAEIDHDLSAYRQPIRAKDHVLAACRV